MRNKIFKYLPLLITGFCIVSCNIPKNKQTTIQTNSAVAPVDENPNNGPKTPEWAPKKYQYNPSRTLLVDLIHTKLEVKFDWEKQQMHGKASLQLKPYFYPQNTVILDAKGFEIKSIELLNKDKTSPLNYTYDNKQISITLDKTYSKDEKFELIINYIAKPNDLPKGGSVAITEDKGLYFINADGKDPEKPKQIWTQGETEASSCWFPTIDSPNEKMTQELYITVDKKYMTLSNGSLIYSSQNEDGTRTDYWKQDQLHAPYLCMMAVGEFAVVKDKWKNIEVDYIIEKEYKPYAKAIFGNTPEMMEFFSNKLQYPFPWDKYSQIVVRDYVSGAMENSSATIMMEALQIDDREMLDKSWDYIIAHELFHHWFGDLVTCESWANLPLNESFANYSEYLWEEYKYGKDAADYHGQQEAEEYFAESGIKREPLIRYYFKDREDMFDGHSYNKGGKILHMLRSYVGDEAFFHALHVYLKKNEFKTAEIHHLRLAFEEVTGEDLNWFFNQYFLSAGHAELLIRHRWKDNKVEVSVNQMQDSAYTPIYKMPLAIDIWTNGVKKRHKITVTKAHEIFSFDAQEKPQLVLFDGDQQLLAEIDHQKTAEELEFQYRNSDKYQARFDALSTLSKTHKDSTKFKAVFDIALNDKFWYLRELALENFAEYKGADSLEMMNKIIKMAQTDPKRSVRAKAIDVLASNNPDKYKDLFVKGLSDSAYSVVSSSIVAYTQTSAPDRLTKIAVFESSKNKDILSALAEVYAQESDTSKYDWFKSKINKLNGMELYTFLGNFSQYLSKMDNGMQQKALSLFDEIARKHTTWYIRFGAFKAISKLTKIQNKNAILKDIYTQEKDEKTKTYLERVIGKQ